MNLIRLFSLAAIRRLKLAVVALIGAATLLGGCVSAPPAGQETADWYYPGWMADAPYAPMFQVLDTESSLGPYARQTKTITLQDLVKMHGHPCDGLVTAACALSLGLRELYPEGMIDRTDTGGICNNSPCYGDVVEYLTGGRIRFGTQKIDPRLGNEFILYRFSTRQAVQVALKPGVFPIEVSRLETKIRGGDFSVADMRRCQQLEWDYARALLSRPLAQSFTVSTLTNFDWQPDAYAHLGKRGDITNKDILKKPAPPK
jgi:formylmethanofuran dehydrogenase subunit E